MTLKFKEDGNKTTNLPPTQPNFQPVQCTQIGMPLAKAIGHPTLPTLAAPILTPKAPPPLEMPGAGLKRAVNYYADYAGCGWWRMISPEVLLNINNKAIINGLTTMVLDPRFYAGIKAVRLQRQATPVQLEFMKFLKAGGAYHGFRTCYEIDDIIFKEDIPDFNRCKVAFENEDIRNSCIEMMRLCDEISVTCDFMKQYYIEHTGNKNITVIPNYPAKMWMDGNYNPEKLLQNYNKFRKKPRIGYVGSGTHVDILNKTNQKDDFEHVVNAIIKTRKDFQWVWIGCFPLPLKPFIDNKEMEYVPWFPLINLAKAYTTTNLNAVFAPLTNCTFNKAKSNIKFLEAATCGVPGIFQNLVTYKDAFLHFDTGADLIDQLKVLLKDENTYMEYSQKSRTYADTMWLDDHLDEHEALYFTPFGSAERNAKSPNLIKNNPDQKITVEYENALLKKTN